MTCGKILSKHDQSHVLLMRFGSSLALSSLRIIIYITGLRFEDISPLCTSRPARASLKSLQLLIKYVNFRVKGRKTRLSKTSSSAALSRSI